MLQEMLWIGIKLNLKIQKEKSTDTVTNGLKLKKLLKGLKLEVKMIIMIQ